MALPTNQNINPLRNTEFMQTVNQEQPFHPIYSYAVITDAVEGLILVDVNTLADGDPRNNHLKRAVTWNEGGVLNGARFVTLAGHYAYVAADAGIVTLDLNDPLNPRVTNVMPARDVRGIAVQFRYLFYTDAEGLKTADVTDLANPKPVMGAFVPLADAQRLYIARTYAYVAARGQGLAIIDVERAERPKMYRTFDAGGQINDAYDVVVGTTNASLFAYIADGVNGLKVVQLTSPSLQPNFYGFSPEPNPELIAWGRTQRPALSLSKGLDRDRAVDETGHQMAVFGRLGSRPFTRKETEAFFLDANGRPWTVHDRVDNNARADTGADFRRKAKGVTRAAVE